MRLADAGALHDAIVVQVRPQPRGDEVHPHELAWTDEFQVDLKIDRQPLCVVCCQPYEVIAVQ